MTGINNNELDPIALWVLLLLSGGQRFNILELTRILNRSFDIIRTALQTLLQRGFVKSEKGRFKITPEGAEYLAFLGVVATEPEDEPEKKDFIRRIRPPFFSSFQELFIWLAAPLMLLIPAFVFASTITAGHNFISPDKRVGQILVWVTYLAFLILYYKLSHHYIMENERLVIFRGGKAIGKKGPGHVFLLPFIDNPKKVDMRERSKEINKEPCITKDNILMNAGFYITWVIDDPIPSLTKVSDIEDAMSLLSAAALRSAIAEYTMVNAMEMRRALNALICRRIEQKASEWGVQVNNTEIRELQPSDSMMKQLENRRRADLESEAVIARSNAKVQSLQQFLTIGAGMARNPIAFNLKYLDTLEKIGEGPSTKYIIPMEFFNLLRDWLQAQGGPGGNVPQNGNNPPEQLPPGGPQQ